MKVYIESTRKSFKYDRPIQGASLCSHLKYAIFHWFLPTVPTFLKKTTKIAILIHKKGLQMI